MLHKSTNTLLFLCCFLYNGCFTNSYTTNEQNKVIESKGIDSSLTENLAHLHYDLAVPSAEFNMPTTLREISGLGINETGDTLVAIQDEKGLLFFIEAKKGVLVETVKFWKDGDYEGVEIVNNKIFVIKNTGTLYEVEWDKTNEAKMTKHKGRFSALQNFEGLGYDPKTNTLLMACKGESLNKNEYKSIYTFSLDSMKFNAEPLLEIGWNMIEIFLENNEEVANKKDFKKDLLNDKGEFRFSPSAIAIHPITGNYYITSSVGKSLLIMERSGKIVHLEPLLKEVHRQPEGLVFDKRGNLYICNEGKKGVAKIYRFDHPE